MKIDLKQFSAAFFEEAEENVCALERGLLLLERAPGDAEQLNAIFRAAHSIKGGSSTFGFADVARFTHALEALLDEVRDGSRALAGSLPGLLLRAADSLRALLDAARTGAPRDAASDAVLAELTALAGSPATAQAHAAGAISQGPQTAPLPPPLPLAEREVRIEFRPAADLFLSGADPLLVLRELAEMGTLVAVDCGAAGVAPLSSLDPERCELSFTLLLRTSQSEAALRDVFCFVEDGAYLAITGTAGSDAAAVGDGSARARPDTAAVAVAGAERHAVDATSIRVPVEKVDQLVDLAGEMVITQSMLSQAMADTSSAGLLRLRETVAQMERNTREMQERVMAVRMVPMGSVLGRFHRVVRDLAALLGKQISLVIEGDEVELDKGVVERIADPLTHLVRNAADHGLETPAERRAAGKGETGTLRLTAQQQGGNVLIEVSDDGRGIDLRRIRDKAIERGLLGAGESLSDDQTRALVFAPGFSTKDEVTAVSGRGVGMDVVKRNIEALGGSVSLGVTDGGGTTCSIRLPLTMAILDGLVLRVGERHFVLPLLCIYESFRPSPSEVRSVLGKGEMVLLRGEAIPLVRLHQVIGVTPEHYDPCGGLVTLVDAGGVRLALLVDALVGQAQVVAKSLEKNFHRVEGVSGATILGDGTVALMLDVQSLGRRIARSEAA